MRNTLFVLLLSFVAAPALADTYRECSVGVDCVCPSPLLATQRLNVKQRGNDNLVPAIRCGAAIQDGVDLLENPPVPPSCANAGEVKPPGLLSVVEAFPQNCGYVRQHFDATAFRETVAQLLVDGTVLCGGKHHSMCTSAVFLAFLTQARRWRDEGRITEEQLALWADLHGPVYQALNFAAQPDELVRQLGVGYGATFRRNELPQLDWPRENDLVQIWRTRPPVSGHSVVAAGPLTDSSGTSIGLCYWSSNLGTNGYGLQCERYADMEKIIVGRLTQ